MNYLGIDIGGSMVKYGILSAEGRILHQQALPANRDYYRTPLMETALKGAEQFLMTLCPQAENPRQAAELLELKGTGIATAGAVDRIRGLVVGAVEHIPSYEGSPLAHRFQALLGLPVHVINDAQAALLAELWLGTAKNLKYALMLTIGTGVGGGLVAEGKLLGGLKGYAGHVGHMTIKKDGPMTPCGNRGTFEEYASTGALIRRAAERLIEEGMPLPEEGLDGRSIFRMAEEGDAMMQVVLDEWIEDMAVGIVNLVYCFNPERVIIGGGVSRQERLLIEPLRRRVRENLMPVFQTDFQLEAARLGNEAGIIGAVYALKTLPAVHI